MKRKSVRKAPRRRAPGSRWKPYGGLILGPIQGPHGSSAGVFVVRDGRRYGVMALSTPTGSIGMGAVGVLDNHAHAIIAEGVRSLAEAKRLGEAWAKKFRKGLVLAPCDCEDMVEAGAPSATRRADDPVASDSLHVVPTGCIGLDIALGIGPESSSKTADAPSAPDKEKAWYERPRRFTVPSAGRKPLLCSRCHRTVIGAHKCSHGNPCRLAPKTLATDRDAPECSYCDDERVDACGFTPSGPGP